MEIYLNSKNELISEKEWKEFIKQIKENSKVSINEKQDAIFLINKYLRYSVVNRIKDLDNLGILYSGALDSTILTKLCQDLEKDFTCYTIGFRDAKDIIFAKKAKKLLNIKLKIKLLTGKDLNDAVSEVMTILRNSNPVYVSIACVGYLGLKFAKDNDEINILNGLGAEEIFCGYQRHWKENYDEVQEESWRGLSEMWKIDLERDFLIAKHLGMNVRTPFMDENLITTAMKINPKLKINNEVKKIILREYAKSIRIPNEIAERPKVAGQYGSKITFVLKKQAKIRGFRTVSEYLKSLL